MREKIESVPIEETLGPYVKKYENPISLYKHFAEKVPNINNFEKDSDGYVICSFVVERNIEWDAYLEKFQRLL